MSTHDEKATRQRSFVDPIEDLLLQRHVEVGERKVPAQNEMERFAGLLSANVLEPELDILLQLRLEDELVARPGESRARQRGWQILERAWRVASYASAL